MQLHALKEYSVDPGVVAVDFGGTHSGKSNPPGGGGNQWKGGGHRIFLDCFLSYFYTHFSYSIDYNLRELLC
jgi:hypothetical protein